MPPVLFVYDIGSLVRSHQETLFSKPEIMFNVITLGIGSPDIKQRYLSTPLTSDDKPEWATIEWLTIGLKSINTNQRERLVVSGTISFPAHQEIIPGFNPDIKSAPRTAGVGSE